MHQLVFYPFNWLPPSPQIRKQYLDPTFTGSPYYGFVGNQKALNRVARVDYDALGKHNHESADINLAFIGKAGTGKTDLVKRHNKARGLPLAEFSPRSIKTLTDVHNGILQALDKAGLTPLIHKGIHVLPPMDIFFDEVHALNNNIVQGLLKATEHNDRILVTEKGVMIDCKYVHWMIATTDRGKLFDAFDTRFMKVNLNMYSKGEIAHIVGVHHNDWQPEVCNLVSHYCGRVPREALAFAREMKLEHNMNPDSWDKIAHKVADDNEIDPHGMTYQRLAILKALGHGPVAEKRLPAVAGVKSEELEKYVLPYLVEDTEEQGAFVTVTTKGYTITPHGIAELDKRKITHKY